MVPDRHSARVLDIASAGDTPRVIQTIRLVPQLKSALTTDQSRMSQKQVRSLLLDDRPCSQRQVRIEHAPGLQLLYDI